MGTCEASDVAFPCYTRVPEALISGDCHTALETLPGRIDALACDIAVLEERLSTPELYAKDPTAFERAAAELAAKRSEQEQAEEQWLEIELRLEAQQGDKGPEET